MHENLLTHLSLLFARLRFALYRVLSRPEDENYKYIRFFRFGIPLVLKCSRRLPSQSTESDALRFLAQSLDVTRVRKSLPLLEIPRLIDSYSNASTGETFTLMTRIQGESLLTASPGMRAEQRLQVHQDIEKFLTDFLWRIPQPAEIAGQVMRSASGHGVWDPVQFREDTAGPFASTLHCYAYLAGYGYRSLNSLKPDLPEDFLEEVPKDVRDTLAADDIVFTHADLRPYNIIVRDGRLVGIIDWEESGWLPRHWSLHVLRNNMPNCGPLYTTYWRGRTFEPNTEAAFTASFSLLQHYF